MKLIGERLARRTRDQQSDLSARTRGLPYSFKRQQPPHLVAYLPGRRYSENRGENSWGHFPQT